MSLSGTASLNLLTIIIATSSPEEEHFPKSLKKHLEGKDLTEKLYHEMDYKSHSFQPMPVVLGNKQWNLEIQVFLYSSFKIIEELREKYVLIKLLRKLGLVHFLPTMVLFLFFF